MAIREGDRAGGASRRGAATEEIAARVWKTSGCQLVNSGVAPGIVLDFGREIHGGVQIMNCSQHGMKVRAFSANRSARRWWTSGTGARQHDMRSVTVSILCRTWARMEIGNTGFRFVRIDLVTAGKLALDCVGRYR